MTKKLNIGDKPFPITPESEEEARLFGQMMMQSLLKLRAPNREKSAVSERFLDAFGAQIGRDIFLDQVPWTVNTFTTRLSALVEGLEAAHLRSKSA